MKLALILFFVGLALGASILKDNSILGHDPPPPAPSTPPPITLPQLLKTYPLKRFRRQTPFQAILKPIFQKFMEAIVADLERRYPLSLRLLKLDSIEDLKDLPFYLKDMNVTGGTPLYLLAGGVKFDVENQDAVKNSGGRIRVLMEESFGDPQPPASARTENQYEERNTSTTATATAAPFHTIPDILTSSAAVETGPTPSQHAKGSKPHFRQMATSFITGATSVSNSNFNNCPVVGKQYNINSSDSNPAKKSIWFNTGEPIPSYTGREDKLEEVHKIFFPTNKEIKPIHQIAIVGLGGVGKSEFTRKFAWKYFMQLDGNAAWINSETVQLLIDSFKELATQIGVKFPELSGKAEILRMVDQVYAYFGEKKSLFIFDNVEDWVDGDNAIKPYLPNRMAPGVEKPFVLMTSRSRPPGGIKLIELSVLEVAEAVNLIKARLDVQEVDCVELLVQLANLLGCLPLALQQASSYIKQEMESDISGKHQNEILASCVETYIEMFEVEAEKLLDYKPSEMDVDFAELKTTLLTWRITYPLLICPCCTVGYSLIK